MFTNQKQYTLHKSCNFYNLLFERFIISLKKYAKYILHLYLPALSNRLQTLNIIKFETLGNKLCWRFQNVQITYLLFLYLSLNTRQYLLNYETNVFSLIFRNLTLLKVFG